MVFLHFLFVVWYQQTSHIFRYILYYILICRGNIFYFIIEEIYGALKTFRDFFFLVVWLSWLEKILLIFLYEWFLFYYKIIIKAKENDTTYKFIFNIARSHKKIFIQSHLYKNIKPRLGNIGHPQKARFTAKTFTSHIPKTQRHVLLADFDESPGSSSSEIDEL